jgi:hypothetical protein
VAAVSERKLSYYEELMRDTYHHIRRLKELLPNDEFNEFIDMINKLREVLTSRKCKGFDADCDSCSDAGCDAWSLYND